MNEIIEKESIIIENMIYEVRGVQVMLSSDIAKIYNVEIEEFCSRSQIVTLNKSNNLRGSNIKYSPYVLTEQGIMMLSGLLKSDIAVKVNLCKVNCQLL